MSKFIVINLRDAHWTTEVDTAEDGAILAESLAADHPGETFSVYQVVSQSYGEPPAKVRPPVVTKDKAVLEAEAVTKAEAKAAAEAVRSVEP